MAGEKKGQITSADNGTNIPDNDGFLMRRPFDLSILNGTSISATLQVRSAFGNWVALPDPNSRSTLSAADVLTVNYNNGGRFRINVTTATGTWDWEADEHNS